MFPTQPDFTIRIDIPALADLVEFLRGGQQKKIDALTAQVAELTAALTQSTTGLDAAVQTQEK